EAREDAAARECSQRAVCQVDLEGPNRAAAGGDHIKEALAAFGNDREIVGSTGGRRRSIEQRHLPVTNRVTRDAGAQIVGNESVVARRGFQRDPARRGPSVANVRADREQLAAFEAFEDRERRDRARALRRDACGRTEQLRDEQVLLLVEGETKKA